MTWSELPPGAKAFRIAHVVWGVGGMSSLGYVWWSAWRRRRDRLLAASVVFLSLEGLALLVGRGNCPLGPLQSRLGDTVPMFELVLPPRAAKAAIPLLTGISLAGFLAAALRGPRPRQARSWQRPGARSLGPLDDGGRVRKPDPVDARPARSDDRGLAAGCDPRMARWHGR